MHTSKIITIILLILTVVTVFSIFSGPISSADFWWHLKSGQYIWETKSLPSGDPFSFTTEWDAADSQTERNKIFTLRQAWLGQIIMYGVYRLFSFEGIIYLRAALLTALILLIYGAVRRERIGLHASLFITLPAVIIFYGFTPERPQLFSFLFFALMVYLLEGFRKSETHGDLSRLVETEKNETRRDSVESQTAETRRDSVETNGDSQVSTNLNKSPLVSGFHQSQPVSNLLYLFPVPIIMLLWANLHGGFFLGIVLLWTYFLAELIKYTTKRFGEPLPPRPLKLLGATALTASLASLINPNGFSVFLILAERRHGVYRHLISETVSTIEHIRMGLFGPELITFLLLILFCLVLFLAHIRRMDLTDALTVIIFAALGIYLFRLIPFFTPLAAIFIARYGMRFSERFRTSRNDNLARVKFFLSQSGSGAATDGCHSGLSGILLSTLLSLLFIFTLIRGSLFGGFIASHIFHRDEVVVGGKYPRGAVNFLKAERIPGNMFNPLDWGGYLMWYLFPEYKVFIDGRGLNERVVVHSAKIMAGDRGDAGNSRSWGALLDHYQVSVVLTYSVEHFTGRLLPLIPALINDREWHLIYADDLSLVFVKETPANEEIVRKYALPKENAWREVITEARLKSKGFFSRNVRANFLITTGDAFLSLRNFELAMDAYARAWNVDPGNPMVRERLQFLERVFR